VMVVGGGGQGLGTLLEPAERTLIAKWRLAGTKISSVLEFIPHTCNESVHS
jgi:hypothetical protein